MQKLNTIKEKGYTKIGRMVGRKSFSVFTFRFGSGRFIDFAFPLSIVRQFVLLIDYVFNTLAQSCYILLRLLLLKHQLMLSKLQQL